MKKYLASSAFASSKHGIEDIMWRASTLLSLSHLSEIREKERWKKIKSKNVDTSCEQDWFFFNNALIFSFISLQ